MSLIPGPKPGAKFEGENLVSAKTLAQSVEYAKPIANPAAPLQHLTAPLNPKASPEK